MPPGDHGTFESYLMLALGADAKLHTHMQPIMTQSFIKLYGPPPDFSKMPLPAAGGRGGARDAAGAAGGEDE